MKLGFMSAIFADLNLEQVVQFARDSKLSCVELMCWPEEKANRRYAGVSHLNVADLSLEKARETKQLFSNSDVEISGLGYYPNPLTADEQASKVAIQQIEHLIRAAATLEIKQVNTFVGRDQRLSIDDNWPRFEQVWKPLIQLAESEGVRVGIENCPMLFTKDEWPGGQNLAHSPAIWERMFDTIPSDHFGLNFDPSHFVWQQMDYLKAVRDFSDKLFHIHAKDARLDTEKLRRVGVLAHPLEYHTPKIPGYGDVDWGKLCSALTDVGYRGPVCIEVEDRAFEDTLERRKESVNQSTQYLRNFILN